MSFYATINNFISENAIIFSVLIPIISGLSGIYFTYKMTIKSDKRKEFNDVAEPVIDAFDSIIQNDRFSGYCLNGLDVNLREIQRRLSQSDKILFCKYMGEYKNITNKIFSTYGKFGQINNENIPDDEIKKEVNRAGLEVGSGDQIIIDKPENLLRISGLIMDSYNYVKDDNNFKRK